MEKTEKTKTINDLKMIVNFWKSKIKLSEQKTQEAISGYHNAFEEYIKAKETLLNLKKGITNG